MKVLLLPVTMIWHKELDDSNPGYLSVYLYSDYSKLNSKLTTTRYLKTILRYVLSKLGMHPSGAAFNQVKYGTYGRGFINIQLIDQKSYAISMLILL